MLRVDTREGSVDYIAPLIAAGLNVQPDLLTAGDFALTGKGPQGNIEVGVEIKQWDDVMACVRSGRFADQLRGMHGAYRVSWLLIEGRIQQYGDKLAIWRNGKWYTPPGRMTYQELTSWLLTMCAVGGVLLWRTESQAESVAWLRSLYWWWVSKDYEQHRAHQDFYQPPVSAAAPWQEPTLVQKWAVNLPGIGSKTAQAVDEIFDSAQDLANASEDMWREIEGVGPKTAAKVVRAIRSKKLKS